MMKDITVLGGSGFIGSRVVWLLRLKGYNPIVFDKTHGKDVLVDPLPKTDVVIHLAARLFDKFNDNLKMTQKVVEAGYSKIVFASSAGVYGDGLNHTEDEPLKPVGPYGKIKAKEEALITKSGKAYAILRLANVYGFDSDHGVVYRFLNGLDTINGDGEQVRDFVWVEDVALALFEAATSKKYNGIYNISTGKKRTIAGLFKQLFPDLIPVHGPLLKEIQVSTLSPAKAMAKGFKPRDILWQTK